MPFRVFPVPKAGATLPAMLRISGKIVLLFALLAVASANTLSPVQAAEDGPSKPFITRDGLSPSNTLGLTASDRAMLSKAGVSITEIIVRGDSRKVRVCTPKKCVTVRRSKFCSGSACGGRLYRRVKAGVYCSASVGCFQYKGKKYKYTNRARIAGDKNGPAKCASSLVPRI